MVRANELVQISVRMTRSDADVLRKLAETEEKSINQFLMHLAQVFKRASRLHPDQRLFLEHLVRWGPLNFRSGPPSPREFSGLSEEGVRKAVQGLVHMKFMEEDKTRMKASTFNLDIVIDGKRFFVNRAGRFAADLMCH